MNFLKVLVLSVVMLSTVSAFAAADKAAAARKIASTAEDCEIVEDLGAFEYPAKKLIPQKTCAKIGGKFCQASDNVMGGRWSSQVLCYKGAEVLGGIRGTYQEHKKEL